ncbi:MAG: hypothetical protein AAFR64_09020 [Pseudomonadota bacterium]
MKSTLKVWTGLGVATALVGAGLAGCAGENGEGGEGGEGAAVAGEAGEGEGGQGEGGEGEGGEGEAGPGDGEGGVAVLDAATDPVTYGAALAIVEAHAIAARDAYLAGKTEEAAEMFAHPVAEVLADMDPVFEQLGVTDFKATMTDASTAAFEADNAAGVEASFDAITEALAAAAEKAPSSDLSAGVVTAGVVSDQIDRAIAMYGKAAGSEEYGPYLDGYGFYKAAAAGFARNSEAVKTYNSGLHGDIAAALDLLETAYPGVERPAAMDVEQGKLLGAASKVKLGLPAK